ncbi:hypothetical protein PIB30_087780, partial [Stylosanthes scabra]|nr:hypothetical protein [Stylosanthes scabra]
TTSSSLSSMGVPNAPPRFQTPSLAFQNATPRWETPAHVPTPTPSKLNVQASKPSRLGTFQTPK